MESVDGQAVHVPPGKGKRLWVADKLMTFVVSGGETGGAYALTDSTVPPGGEAPPHVHRREDEAFWVLEGEIEVTVGDDTLTASRDSFVRLPRDVPHSYVNAATFRRRGRRGAPDRRPEVRRRDPATPITAVAA